MEERDNINVSSSVKLKPFEKRLSELYYKHKNVNIRLVSFIYNQQIVLILICTYMYYLDCRRQYKIF